MINRSQYSREFSSMLDDLESDSRKIRAQAAHLRRKFDGHSDTVRSIVAELSDTELIAMDAAHHESSVSQAKKAHESIPLQKLLDRAVEEQSNPIF